MKFAVLESTEKNTVTEMLKQTVQLSVLYGRLTPTEKKEYENALAKMTVPSKTATQTANLGGNPFENTKNENEESEYIKLLKNPREQPKKVWYNDKAE